MPMMTSVQPAQDDHDQEPPLVEEDDGPTNLFIHTTPEQKSAVVAQKKKDIESMLSPADKKTLWDMDDDSFLVAMGTGPFMAANLNLQDVDINTPKPTPKLVSEKDRPKSDASASTQSLSGSSSVSSSSLVEDELDSSRNETTTSSAPPPTKIADLLYDIKVPITNNGLLIMLKPVKADNLVIFDGYAKKPNGEPGPAETEKIFRNKGDVVIAINDCQIKGLMFPTILKLIKQYVSQKDPSDKESMTIKFKMMDASQMPKPKTNKAADIPTPSLTSPSLKLSALKTSLKQTGPPIKLSALKDQFQQKLANTSSKMEQYATKDREVDDTTNKETPSSTKKNSFSAMKESFKQKKEEIFLRSPDVTKGFEKMGSRMKLFTSSKFQKSQPEAAGEEQEQVDFTNSATAEEREMETETTKTTAKQQLRNAFHSLEKDQEERLAEEDDML